jgi:imidazolonepropionase
MLLIKNIKQLIQVRPEAPMMLRGNEMAELPVLDNAWLLIENGLIHSFGEMNSCP